MENLRGWIGVGVFLIGIAALFFDKTKNAAFVLIGFGAGMMSSGFK